MSTVDEFALIRLLNAGKQSEAFQRSRGVVVGIGDDAAVVEAGRDRQLVLTCDTMTAEAHFKPVTMRDADIGYKAMASAASDIAAMGGQANYALAALTLPPGVSVDRVKAIYDGLYECANEHGIVIVGGDTVSGRGGLTLSVTVVGEVPTGRALLRSGAQPGDVVFVTGDLGLSAAGLAWLLGLDRPASAWDTLPELEEYPTLRQRHTRPKPQLEAGGMLRDTGYIHALNDISDGLASEAWEIAEASGVGIDLIEERLLIHPELQAYAARCGEEPLNYILYGGEDYELVGTVPAEHAMELQIRFREAGLTLLVVGYVQTDYKGVRLVRGTGDLVPVDKKGYNHLQA